jgi:hypothetical protein
MHQHQEHPCDPTRLPPLALLLSTVAASANNLSYEQGYDRQLRRNGDGRATAGITFGFVGWQFDAFAHFTTPLESHHWEWQRW